MAKKLGVSAIPAGLDPKPGAGASRGLFWYLDIMPWGQLVGTRGGDTRLVEAALELWVL